MGVHVYEHVVQDIKEMIFSSLEKGQALELAAILWSIDSRHRLIPELAEINCALSELDGFQILREGKSPFITRAEKGATDEVTKNDFKLAQERSNAVLAGNP